jgi:hypothetical protein
LAVYRRDLLVYLALLCGCARSDDGPKNGYTHGPQPG